MAYPFKLICRLCSPIIIGMLLLQSVFAQPDFREADKWLKDHLKDLGGRAVLVILKDGKLVHNVAANDMTRKQKMLGKIIAKKRGNDPSEALEDFNSGTRQPIASCSKWLSAALVMTFVDEGKLKLEDSLGKYLPVMTRHGKGNIRIWQCLSHLTGIKSAGFKENRELINNTETMDEAIRYIAKLPMEGKPGKVFHYGNTGLQLAAAVIEKIGGKSFNTLFKERIAIPCQMTQTDFGKSKVPLAAGGAWSTAKDYLNFLNMILQEGKFNGRQILSKNAVIEMQKNRVGNDVSIASSPAEAADWGYGFGTWVMDDATGNQRSKAVTSPGLFGSFPWVDNHLKYAAFLFTFNIKSKGRNELYTSLKQIIDKAFLVK